MLLPHIVSAATDNPFSVKELMFRISYYILNPLIILAFILAMLYFLWGMIEFLQNRSMSPEKSNQGKNHMLYGIIGMVIMVSAFAIMRALASIIGADPVIVSEIPSGN